MRLWESEVLADVERAADLVARRLDARKKPDRQSEAPERPNRPMSSIGEPRPRRGAVSY